MTAIAFRLFLLFALTIPGAALAARSDWTSADQSQMRLLLAAPQNPGDVTLAGGVEIVLEPGWHTYWHNPGEAGVPPVFDFSGSENVADVVVHYPVPVRYDDGGSVSLVYYDDVVFPLTVTPADPGAPVRLNVALLFGVCAEVCIPTRASAEVTLPEGSDHDPLTEARLKRFTALLPEAPDPGRFDVEAVTAADDDALIIDVRMPQSSYLDLFANPPAGWFLGQPVFVSRDGDVSRYRLSLAGRPKDATAIGQTFQFVAVSGGKAIEATIAIDD